MTTYGQAEFEALGLLQRRHTTSVKVSTTLTNHPDMLTDKELEVDNLNTEVKTVDNIWSGCHHSVQINGDWS